jgi:hypothetical protein
MIVGEFLFAVKVNDNIYPSPFRAHAVLVHALKLKDFEAKQIIRKYLEAGHPYSGTSWDTYLSTEGLYLLKRFLSAEKAQELQDGLDYLLNV